MIAREQDQRSTLGHVAVSQEQCSFTARNKPPGHGLNYSYYMHLPSGALNFMCTLSDEFYCGIKMRGVPVPLLVLVRTVLMPVRTVALALPIIVLFSLLVNSY